MESGLKQQIDEGGIQWPCPTKDHPGTTTLYSDLFPFVISPRLSIETGPSGIHPMDIVVVLATSGVSGRVGNGVSAWMMGISVDDPVLVADGIGDAKTGFVDGSGFAGEILRYRKLAAASISPQIKKTARGTKTNGCLKGCMLTDSYF